MLCPVSDRTEKKYVPSEDRHYEREEAFIRTLVAECLGSQDVRFDRSAREAVKKLCEEYKRLRSRYQPNWAALEGEDLSL